MKTVIESQLGVIDATVWTEWALHTKHQGRFRGKCIDKYYMLHTQTDGDGKRKPLKLLFG